MPSSCGNQRRIICCPRNYWSQLHSLSVGLSTVHPVPPLERLAQGGEAIGASHCGLPSRSCWMRCVCPPCSTCTTAPTCVVVAKCRDARLRIIFSVRSSRRGLPAAQHCCSEKSSQLQSNMSYAFVILWCFISFCDILWQFLSFFQSMCLMVGNVRGTKSAWFLVFARVLKLPSEERPRLVPLGARVAWKVLGRSWGRMGGWWQHRNFDQQLWLLSLAVSRCKDWIFVRYLFTDDLGFCMLLSQSIVDICQEIGISELTSISANFPIVQLGSISCPIRALSTFVLFWSTRHAKKRKLYKIVMHHAHISDDEFSKVVVFLALPSVMVLMILQVPSLHQLAHMLTTRGWLALLEKDSEINSSYFELAVECNNISLFSWKRHWSFEIEGEHECPPSQTFPRLFRNNRLDITVVGILAASFLI